MLISLCYKLQFTFQNVYLQERNISKKLSFYYSVLEKVRKIDRARIRLKYRNDRSPAIVARLSSKPHWSGNIRGPLIRLREFNATAMRRLSDTKHFLTCPTLNKGPGQKRILVRAIFRKVGNLSSRLKMWQFLVNHLLDLSSFSLWQRQMYTSCLEPEVSRTRELVYSLREFCFDTNPLRLWCRNYDITTWQCKALMLFWNKR